MEHRFGRLPRQSMIFDFDGGLKVTEYSKVQKLSLWYGYFGLIPFVGLSLVIAIGIFNTGQVRWLYDSYSALVLSFMAGVYWPMAMKEHGPACPARLMRASILMSLWAWFTLMIPEVCRPVAFSAGFAVLFGIDRFVLEDLWPWDYLKMRMHLTVVVIASQILVAMFN
ncbi:DUF3429 domain-containing protein [Hahella ganghwensis]|uniref:DUF3429 domain-containing protein n=1 Tax=Hahella ganghwensis TaxID=286420 RepID=UPI00047623D2|nr:DUF3429 domain-containing protein [Hahella ganghwensis]